MSSVTTTPNPPLELDSCVEPIVAISKMMAAYLGIPAVRSWLYNQTWAMPAEPQMFQVLSVVSDQPYASELAYAGNPVTGDLEETIQNNARSIIQYEIWSRDASARLNRFKALAALHSTACQQMCEQYGFSVAQIPLAFTDLSYVDGMARVNRYAITFAVLTATAFTRPVEYFDKPPKTNPSLLIEA